MPWPRTSPASRGYGTAWRKLRELVLIRDQYLCLPCKRLGRITAAREVDHIVRKKDASEPDRIDGLQSICTPCHKAKTLKENGVVQRPWIGLDGFPVDE